MPLAPAQLWWRRLIDVILVFPRLKLLEKNYHFPGTETSKLEKKTYCVAIPGGQYQEFGGASSFVTCHMKMKFIITELQLRCSRGPSSKHVLMDMDMSWGPKFTIK
jgi:hypothetical protein